MNRFISGKFTSYSPEACYDTGCFCRARTIQIRKLTDIKKHVIFRSTTHKTLLICDVSGELT